MKCPPRRLMVCPLGLAVTLAFWQYGLSAETASGRPVIHVHVFLSKDCDECKLVKKEAIAKLAEASVPNRAALL